MEIWSMLPTRLPSLVSEETLIISMAQNALLRAVLKTSDLF